MRKFSKTFAFAKRNIKEIVRDPISLIFMILLLVPVPMFNCSLGKESYFCLVLWIALGIVFYVRSGNKEKAQ